MKPKLSLLLILLIPALALGRSLSAGDETDLRQHARELLLRQVTGGSGELGQFQAVEAEGFFLADLDGQPPREAVVDLYHYVGEGATDYHLAVYAFDYRSQPRLLTLVPYLDEYMDGVHLEATDLDGDGQDELFVVGGTDGVAPSDLRILSWHDGRFRDMVGDPDPGTAYFRVDLDGDGGQEIVALGLASPGFGSVTVRVLRRDGEGFYRESPVAALPELLIHTFRDALAAGRVARPAYDLPLLVQALREQGRAPENLSARQADLESLYRSHDGKPYDQEQIVAAMAWPGNASALPLVENILAAEESDHWVAGEAAMALAAIRGERAADDLFALLQERLLAPRSRIEKDLVNSLVAALLQVGDRRGLELAVDVASDPSVPSAKRRRIIFWVLGRYPTEIECVLFDLATGAPNPEIQRVAAARLEEVDREATRLTTADLLAGLGHSNEQVRASFALLVGRLGRQDLLSHLLEALGHEEQRWPRRQLLLALSELEVAGRLDVFELVSALLEKETDLEIRQRLQRLKALNAPPTSADSGAAVKSTVQNSTSR